MYSSTATRFEDESFELIECKVACATGGPREKIQELILWYPWFHSTLAGQICRFMYLYLRGKEQTVIDEETVNEGDLCSRVRHRWASSVWRRTGGIGRSAFAEKAVSVMSDMPGLAGVDFSWLFSRSDWGSQKRELIKYLRDQLDPMPLSVTNDFELWGLMCVEADRAAVDNARDLLKISNSESAMLDDRVPRSIARALANRGYTAERYAAAPKQVRAAIDEALACCPARLLCIRQTLSRVIHSHQEKIDHWIAELNNERWAATDKQRFAMLYEYLWGCGRIIGVRT
jgi:hypothetical protein